VVDARGWATASTTLLSLKSLCGGGVPSSHPSLGLSFFFLSFLLYFVYLSMGVYFRVFARLWTENTLGSRAGALAGCGAESGAPRGILAIYLKFASFSKMISKLTTLVASPAAARGWMESNLKRDVKQQCHVLSATSPLCVWLCIGVYLLPA